MHIVRRKDSQPTKDLQLTIQIQPFQGLNTVTSPISTLDSDNTGSRLTECLDLDYCAGTFNVSFMDPTCTTTRCARKSRIDCACIGGRLGLQYLLILSADLYFTQKRSVGALQTPTFRSLPTTGADQAAWRSPCSCAQSRNLGLDLYIYEHPARPLAVTFMLCRMDVDIMAIHAHLGSAIMTVEMVNFEDASFEAS